MDGAKNIFEIKKNNVTGVGSSNVPVCNKTEKERRKW